MPVEQTQHGGHIGVGTRDERADEKVAAATPVKAVADDVIGRHVHALERPEQRGGVGLEEALPVRRVVGIRARLGHLLAGAAARARETLN